MGTITFTDIPEFTEQHIDECVASRTKIWGWGGGYDARTGSREKRVGGWLLKVIATGGVGNRGTVIAVPQNARTGAIFHRAKIDLLCEAGFSLQQAERYYTATFPRKWEDGVLKAVLTVINDSRAVTAVRKFPGIGPGKHKSWEESWDMAGYLPGMSWPRKESAYFLAAAVAE